MIWFKISLPHKRHILITIITLELQKDPALMMLATGKEILLQIFTDYLAFFDMPSDHYLTVLINETFISCNISIS